MVILFVSFWNAQFNKYARRTNIIVRHITCVCYIKAIKLNKDNLVQVLVSSVTSSPQQPCSTFGYFFDKKKNVLP